MERTIWTETCGVGGRWHVETPWIGARGDSVHSIRRILRSLAHVETSSVREVGANWGVRRLCGLGHAESQRTSPSGDPANGGVWRRSERWHVENLLAEFVFSHVSRLVSINKGLSYNNVHKSYGAVFNLSKIAPRQ